jgi:hypothetical protein
LRERPRTRAAARMVGRMSLIEARADGRLLALAGLALRLAPAATVGLSRVTVGVPPGAVRVVRAKQPGNDWEPGFACGQVFVGGQRCVLIDAQAGARLIAIAPLDRIVEGDAVWLALDETRLVVLADG